MKKWNKMNKTKAVLMHLEELESNLETLDYIRKELEEEK